MHRVFQRFIDNIWESVDLQGLQEAMAEATPALDLRCFAYLSMPRRRGADAHVISTYPAAWTGHYVESHYERVDPVILRAARAPDPFEWGHGVDLNELTPPQQRFFDEAAGFGIRCGFTIPIHDGQGPVAAITFAADQRHPAFRRSIEIHGPVLQLMAMYFHAHARRKLVADRVVDGAALSPREFECLEWAARGKSAWEIGCILGISRRTVAFHLDNARAKLDVRTVCQAVARLSASKATSH